MQTTFFRSKYPVLSGIFYVILWLPATTFTQTAIDSVDYFIMDQLEAIPDQDAGNQLLDFTAEQSPPYSIHTVTASQLRLLGILSEQQIQQLLYYRATQGPFIALYELQVIPLFDLPTVHAIRPFLTLNTALDDYQVPFWNLFGAGRRELYLRWSRILEPQEGYETTSNSRYLGSPDRLSFRFRHQHSNKLSFGFAGEKDRGEPFFEGSNRYGFDFYSAHFFLRNYRHNIKALAIGNYKISLGEGLLIYQGFSGGKGATATALKKPQRILAPHQSTGESRFLSGIATTLQLGKWRWTLFTSRQRRDGRIEHLQDNTPIVRALYEDGLHQTQAAFNRKKRVVQWTSGQQLHWQFRSLQLSLNTLFVALDKPLVPAYQPYNRFYFRGKQQLNHSVDYSFRYRNMHFFGETAVSKNGALATINGLLLGLGPQLELAVLHRHYSRHYHALLAAAFAENSRVQNEKGIYAGLQFRPVKGMTISAFADHWQHPWLRFRADGPSYGRDYRLRLTHTQKRKHEVYLEYRDKTKAVNAPDSETQANFLVPERTVQWRLHANRMLNKKVELRSRVDVGFADSPIHNRQRGFSAFQDVLYRPIQFPLSFTFRFAIFDTDGYQARYYNYENNLLNTFAIPAYYNRGTRWYLNLRYKAGRRWTLEGRIAQTKWENQETVGSGTEATLGPVKTEISVQIRYQVEAKK
jgi:hypothetical protein